MKYHYQMVIVLRKFLVTALITLQLFLPLVHAHSGGKSLNQGLHVPGLESYNLGDNAAVLRDFKAGQDAEGLLVLVDAGIKNAQDVFAAPATLVFLLLATAQVRFSPVLPNSSFFLSYLPPPGGLNYFPAFSPRAPPLQ